LHELERRNRPKYVKMIVGYFLLIELSIHGNMLTITGS
jgi:hypothetical protein